MARKASTALVAALMIPVLAACGVVGGNKNKDRDSSSNSGAGGQLVDLAPVVLLDKPVSKSTKTGKVTWNKCTLEAALPSDHEQVEKDMRTVVCYLDMQQTVAKLA